MNRAPLIPIAVALLALTAAPALAADRFLRPPVACPTLGDGTAYACAASDGGPGAWNDWGAAVAGLGAGDVLRVEGDWALSEPLFVTPDGTASAPIRLTSQDPAQPAHLDGSALYLTGDYLELDHFALANGCLVVKDPCTDCTNHGVRVHDNVFGPCDNGVSISQTEDVEIRDNVFHDIGSTTDNQGHCIYPAQGATNVRAFRNRCVAKPDVFRAHCLHVYHSEPPGPAEDVDFHDNVCLGFTTGAGLYSGSKNVRVRNNVFSVAVDNGLTCRYGGSSGSTFVNNIVLGDAAYGAFIEDAGCELLIDHNVYFQTSGGAFAFTMPDVGEVPWSTWQQGHDASSQLADPRLADVAAGDVHLQDGSPCIDTGDNAFAADTDFYGGSRIVNGTVDVGAAEYGSESSGGAGGRSAGAGGEATSASSASAGGSPGATGGAEANPTASDDSGGCACSTPTGRSRSAAALLLLGAMLLVARRRRQPA